MQDKGPEPGITEKPEPEDFQEEQQVPPEEQQKSAVMGTKLRDIIQSFRRRSPEEPLSQEEIMQLEMGDIKEGKIVPTEADIIECICPKCGAANEERNYFCFKCGNRLRRKAPKEDDTGTHLKVEPSTIEIVEDQRVAKIVICPKCNVPNKVGDKFCWSCGKKIKSDSKEAQKKIEMEESILPKKDGRKSKKKKSKPI
ncbi:zinc ribbon domain-containing protein, partial [bacterium]|nr:zinc ribbon domain-containing protein [bacterium]